MNSGTTTSLFFFVRFFCCYFSDPAHLTGRVSVIVHRMRASCTYFPSGLSMATGDGRVFRTIVVPMHKPDICRLGQFACWRLCPFEQLRVVSILHHHIDTLPACTPVPRSVRMRVWPEAPSCGMHYAHKRPQNRLRCRMQCRQPGVDNSAQSVRAAKGPAMRDVTDAY